MSITSCIIILGSSHRHYMYLQNAIHVDVHTVLQGCWCVCVA